MSDAVREAAEKLVARLDEVHYDPRYLSVWTLAAIHGGPYEGPQYRQEHENLRNALAESDHTRQAIRDFWSKNYNVLQSVPKPVWDELDKLIRADALAKAQR